MKRKQNCNVVVQWSVQGSHILAVFFAILYTSFGLCAMVAGTVQMQCYIVDCIRDWKSCYNNINFMKFRYIFLSNHKLYIFKFGTH
jgi:hypothetical protein